MENNTIEISMDMFVDLIKKANAVETFERYMATSKYSIDRKEAAAILGIPYEEEE